MSAIKFETDRLIVREFTLDDVPDCFEIYSQPLVQRFLKREPVMSHEEMRERLTPVVEAFRDQPFGSWAMCHRSDQRVIGSSILKPLPDDTRVEVGWHLHPDYWGQGFATEAAKGALAYGFGAQKLSEIYAILLPDNVKSRNVALRIGMEFQELTTRYHDLELELFRIDAKKFGGPS